uniref:Uncharacterized protein n=1 Tax=Arundo donax TaxID=35708 RepID=A0A0A9B858_ARUDO
MKTYKMYMLAATRNNSFNSLNLYMAKKIRGYMILR